MKQIYNTSIVIVILIVIFLSCNKKADSLFPPLTERWEGRTWNGTDSTLSFKKFNNVFILYSTGKLNNFVEDNFSDTLKGNWNTQKDSFFATVFFRTTDTVKFKATTNENIIKGTWDNINDLRSDARGMFYLKKKN